MPTAAQWAQALLECVSTGLAEAGTTPGRVGILAGEVVWDECDCAGLLWGAVERRFAVDPEQGFPAEGGPASCTTGTAADLVFGYTTCWPTLSDRGTPPTAAALQDAALALYAVGETIHGALACCLASQDDDEWVLGSLTVVGPTGGCISVEVRVTVEVSAGALDAALDLPEFPAVEGPPGPPGPEGPQGEQGVQGVQGETGPAGAQGPAGPTGPVGPAGLEWQGEWDPDTAYAADDAVAHDGSSWFAASPSTGVEPDGVAPEWGLLSAVGATGPEGPQGPTGAQGPQGVQGLQGPQGIQGPAGVDGADGDPGPTGPAGPAGPAGAAGAAGATGPTGPGSRSRSWGWWGGTTNGAPNIGAPVRLDLDPGETWEVEEDWAAGTWRVQVAVSRTNAGANAGLQASWGGVNLGALMPTFAASADVALLVCSVDKVLAAPETAVLRLTAASGAGTAIVRLLGVSAYRTA